MLKRPMTDIAAEKKLPSVISSILGEVAEEDRPILGKLESLQQAVADATAARKRIALRKQRKQNEKALYKLGEEAKADKERARVCRAEKVAAEKAATGARASVEELEARLAEAKKNLAAETAKLEGADLALKAIKT